MRKKETYDFKSMSNDPDSHEFLAVVSSVHHQGVCQSLDDRALGFPESFCGVSAGGVGDVDWGADLDVISISESKVSAGRTPCCSVWRDLGRQWLLACRHAS